MLCRRVALGLAPESDGARQLRQGLGCLQVGHLCSEPTGLEPDPYRFESRISPLVPE